MHKPQIDRHVKLMNAILASGVKKREKKSSSKFRILLISEVKDPTDINTEIP